MSPSDLTWKITYPIIVVHFGHRFSPNETRQFERVGMFFMFKEMIISFCSQLNLPITNPELNRSALSRPVVEGRCLWERERCPVLQGWVEFWCRSDAVAGTKPSSMFLALWAGLLAVTLQVILLCHLLDCYLQCSNDQI